MEEKQKSKSKKFKNFENQSQCINLTQAILEKKKVQDIIDKIKPKPTTIAQIRKKDKNNAIFSKIIKQGVNSDLYINIIREHD